MTRVVFAWELGAFLGHVERNLAVAQRLRETGADVTFIISNLQTAEKLLAPEGFPYLPAPGFRHAHIKPRPAINISDLLADLGYGDPTTLLSLVRSWMELWKLLKPDVIVTDYAPSAVLSAKVAGIRNLPLGPGFSIPPAQDPMPAYRADQRQLVAQLRAADQRLLPAINEVLKAFAHPAFKCVGDLFENPAAQVTSFPELDPFGPRNGAQYVGPVKAPGRFEKVEWQTTRPVRIFAYLQPTMVGLDAMLSAIREPAYEAVCVIPGAPGRIVSQHNSEALRVLSAPVDLEHLLPTASLVIGYASAGLVSSSLQSGVPMLLFPNFLEHQLTGMCAERMGAAVVCLVTPTRDLMKRSLNAMLANPAYRNSAKAFGRRYRNYQHQAAIDSVANVIRGEGKVMTAA
jgi:UDP:flavonoid glycosyltransferase YjiC (YdhE family)